MPTYVSLLNWTEKGVQGYKDTIDRAAAVEKLCANFGGQLREVFWTLGPYDAVGIFEFPDDETATAVALNFGSQGNVRTTTLRAFNRDEMKKIISKSAS